jgi:hypothetical protein
MTLKLKMLWGGDPQTPALVWESYLFSKPQGWQVWGGDESH